MEAYKEDLKLFREKTTLTVFCETQKKRPLLLSQDFQDEVAKFAWPDNITLEVVEQFRQKHACHVTLQKCAMMLAEVCSGLKPLLNNDSNTFIVFYLSTSTVSAWWLSCNMHCTLCK